MNVNADFYSSLTFPIIMIEICIYNPKMGNHVENMLCMQIAVNSPIEQFNYSKNSVHVIMSPKAQSREKRYVQLNANWQDRSISWEQLQFMRVLLFVQNGLKIPSV